MTDMIGNVDLDKLKPGDLLKVVPHGKKTLGLEKVEAGKTVPVLLELPKGLHRVWLARATLFDNSLNQEIIKILDEVMQGWADIAAGDEFDTVLNAGKKDKNEKAKK
jgi:hypothetical protein